MTSDNDIAYIFNNVAHDYGIEYVSVRITHFKHFKIKWSKTVDDEDIILHFTVSHYMRMAPEWFVRESANRIFSQILRGVTPTPTKEYDDWLEENRHVWQVLRGE